MSANVMSLVQTCRANEVNPFDYMLAVVRNAQAAKADPGRWIPWNFRESLAALARTARGRLGFFPEGEGFWLHWKLDLYSVEQ